MNILFTLVMLFAYARVAPVATADRPATAPSTQPQQQIFLLHLPGIGGLMRIDKLLTGGLKSGGLDGADVVVYDWTNGTPGLPALGAVQRNKQEARKIARMIEQRVRAHPDGRIVITGHSGGSGLAVWALESLPDDVQIDTLVMLAPALSPSYDLSAALRHVKNKAYAFNSEYDPVLGAGTRAFGTIDRIMTNAAGRVGFEKPPGADDEQYAKLVQIPYDRGFMIFGNIGDHIGPMMPRFAARVIAPLILTGELPRPATQPSTRPATMPTTAPAR
jgi:pimeloyl-ACP methyl ester carboxylesterase